MSHHIHRITELAPADLPYSLRIVLENLLRHEDGEQVTADQVRALLDWGTPESFTRAIDLHAARVFLHDTNGVPTLVDLAAMRDATVALGGDPAQINPVIPAELVVDHSVIADVFGTPDAFARNVEIEYGRNAERYRFLKWGQGSLRNFAVVPPGTGIMHQVNVEYLSRVVMADEGWAYPDVCLGTDSHTTMVNGLGVLAWGIGGIEAEAAMLGQPLSMLLPPVVGVRLHGALPEGTTATDLVLTITELMRRHGVVGKFVEFSGPGVTETTLADRVTISNMSPEFGSTCAYFPDRRRDAAVPALHRAQRERVALVEAYAKEQGLWHEPDRPRRYTEHVELDLSTVVPSLAGPAPAAGPRAARPLPYCVPPRARRHTRPRRGEHRRRLLGRRGVRGVVPVERRSRDRRRTTGRGAAGTGPHSTRAPEPAQRTSPRHPRRGGARDRPRRGRHRRDHLVHQHLQPVGDGGRRAARAERGAPRPAVQALGQDQPLARLPRRHRLLRQGRAHPVPGEARLPPGRVRLHDLHRRLRTTDRRGHRRHRAGPRRRVRCCRETATSTAASTPTSG